MSTQIAIIDYNAGNVRSVQFALQRFGLEARLTSDAREIQAADKVIFPGVGEANTTYLQKFKLRFCESSQCTKLLFLKT